MIVPVSLFHCFKVSLPHLVPLAYNVLMRFLSPKMHQIQFLPRLRPGPRWGNLHRSPYPLSGGEGARCPLPRTLPRSRPFGPCTHGIITSRETARCSSWRAVKTRSKVYAVHYAAWHVFAGHVTMFCLLIIYSYRRPSSPLPSNLLSSTSSLHQQQSNWTAAFRFFIIFIHQMPYTILSYSWINE